MDRVYVGNLPPDIRIKDIDDFFRPFGKLVSIDVNNRGNPAFALVQFDNERNAINAVRARCGYDYEGYTLQVKLVRNSNDVGFEVRNQRRQVTPPPPPPLFNDFNNQRTLYGVGNNFGDNNNSGGFGNNDYGNNNFGNKFVPDNINNRSNNNFMNSTFQSNMSSQNAQYPNNSILSQNMQYPNNSILSQNMQYPTREPTQNNIKEYPTSSRWNDTFNSVGVSNRSGGGFDRSGGGFDRSGGPNRIGEGYGRRGGGFNRNDGGSNRGAGGSYRGGGERTDYDNRYNDDNFEDSFTQGLSGSGRKWFNRYIRKGFSAKIAREKALEHRTVPYLRGGTNYDEIPNNTVANLPLPALENIGNKLISLFGAGGVDNFGDNGNQMTSNFSNWSGGNFQGDFFTNQQNDFNMAGRSSSNYGERSFMSRRGRNANREGRPDAKKEKGVLEKILAEIPTYSQRKIVARQQYTKSLSILKRIETKKDKDFKDRKQRQYHKNIIQEYEDLYKNPQTLRNVKPEPGKGGKRSLEKNGADLKQEYQRRKRQLYVEARRMPDFPKGVLSESAKSKVRLLVRNGFEQNGSKILARLPLTKIKNFIDMKIEYENSMKNRFKESPNKTTTKTVETAATTKTDSTEITKPKSDKETAYHNNVKLLKKYEQSKTINDNIKRLLLTCLKKVHQYEEEMKLPKTTSKFTNLLPKATAEPKAKKVENKVQPKDKQNDTTTAVKENVVNEDKPKITAENEEENDNNNDDACEVEDDQENMEQTEEQNDQGEEEYTGDQNDEDNAELEQEENDDDNGEITEDQNYENEEEEEEEQDEEIENQNHDDVEN